jgi:glycosyltransferase involved in cell wall biosynthesis
MKKKILFLYGPLNAGGAERVLIDILKNLDYKRNNVTLCLIVNQGVLLHEIPKEVTLISLWDDYSLYYKIAFRMSIWFSNSFMFKRILKKKITEHYDAEISFLEGMPLKLHALMETKAQKLSWVHCDLYNFHYTNKQFEKNEELAAYNKMDSVICVSNDTLQAFKKRFPDCTASKLVLYNPIDSKKIIGLANAEELQKNKEFTIVSVGRLTLQKKPERFIRLAARLKSEGIKVLFQILGDGELKNDLKLRTSKLGLDDCINFEGYVSNPYPYIKNADLLLLCSGFEGFGLVVCEAMVLGVPVVSTKTAGPIEILDENRYGLLCDHDDQSIYEAVKKMIDEESLRLHYQKVGYTRALDFSVENTIKQFEALI